MKTVNIRTVADTLHVCLPTAYGLVRDGRLQGFRIGRLWRVSETSLERFLQGETAPHDPPDTVTKSEAA